MLVITILVFLSVFVLLSVQGEGEREPEQATPLDHAVLAAPWAGEEAA